MKSFLRFLVNSPISWMMSAILLHGNNFQGKELKEFNASN